MDSFFAPTPALVGIGAGGTLHSYKRLEELHQVIRRLVADQFCVWFLDSGQCF